ncbi:carnitine O-acetyltransferase-like isoform X2 [Dysidea avara]|uniref:carnitine O-acetyltransferase-like isoform X2 n=1 Tax=Dysidea avara TaxID=196820 RepID=UPI0033229B8B
MIPADLTQRSVISYNPQGPKGDMLKHQSSLPKLPVPPIQQSLQKYLKAMQPLVNNDEYQKTLVAVKEFGKPNGIGEKLQRKLEERAKTHDNWLTDWWLYIAYLGYRKPLVINSNPSIVYTAPFINATSYIHYAMRTTIAVAKFLLLARSEKIDVEMTKVGPLCMSQYLDILSCCRIPGEEVDTQRRSPIEHSCHIIVAHNGHFFLLEILGKLSNGSFALVPAKHIEEQLHKIVNSSLHKAQHSVGVLTSEHRDTWYKARQRLMIDAVNKNSLDMIERAQFLLCLDPGITHDGSNALNVASNRGLHGNGTADSSCNRWFDHTIQIFLSPDGYGGCNLEHSAADGSTAIQVIYYIVHNVHQLNPARKLQWNISLECANDIGAAKVNLDNEVSNCDHQVFVFEDFGKALVKLHKLSPDSFIQAAIQLTYYKMYGCLTSTYESGFTRLFLYGRTDTIRASSIESLAFCKAMLDPSVTVNERLAKMKAAIESHQQNTIEAVFGEGFDRHLLGLRIQCTLDEVEMPSIFTDSSFAKCFHHSLSTSQMPADFPLLCAFGAMVPDGYGICYNPQNDNILLTVSTCRDCAETDTTQFGMKLMESLQVMKDVMSCHQSLSKL